MTFHGIFSFAIWHHAPSGEDIYLALQALPHRCPEICPVTWHVYWNTQGTPAIGDSTARNWTNILCCRGQEVETAISYHRFPGPTHSEQAIPWDVLCTWVLDGVGNQPLVDCTVRLLSWERRRDRQKLASADCRNSDCLEAFPRKWANLWAEAPSLGHMLSCPIVLHLQNTDSNIQLLRLSRQWPQNINLKYEMLLRVGPFVNTVIAQVKAGSAYRVNFMYS